MNEIRRVFPSIISQCSVASESSSSRNFIITHHYFCRRFRKADLPSYDPNLELVQLFKEDNLCQPRNLEKLKPRTCNAFNRLAKYQNNEFELFPGTYQDILGLLTETEDSHVQIKLQPIRLINKRLERRANSFHDYKLHVRYYF